MWLCLNCGEESDDNFDVCWNCQTVQGKSSPPLEEQEVMQPSEDEKLTEENNSHLLHCTKCQVVLSSQKHRCPNCGTRQSPLFAIVVPVLLVILTLSTLIGSIIKVLERRPPDAIGILALFAVLSLFVVLIAYSLYSGKTWSWHLWTFVLGLLAFLTTMSLALLGMGSASNIPGLCGGIFFLSAIIYTGVVWRTAQMKTWRIATIAYATVNGILLIILNFSQIEKPVLAETIFAGTVMLLIILSYSIRVRRWYRIGLGWTGKFIQ